MNLLELMVKGGVKWPEGAEFAAQDCDGELDFYKSMPVLHENGIVWDMNNEAGYITSALLRVVASDRLGSVITREQYEQAKEQAVKKLYTEDEAKEYMDTEKTGILSDLETPLQHEISKTISTLSEADISDEAAEVIIEHLRELLVMRREELAVWDNPCAEPLVVKHDSEPQLTITDWRDLRTGDAVQVRGNKYSITHNGVLGAVAECNPSTININDNFNWRFISRPE